MEIKKGTTVGEMITQLCKYPSNTPIYCLIKGKHVYVRDVKKSNKVKGYENGRIKPIVINLSDRDENDERIKY